jgi:hypothetical protein
VILGRSTVIVVVVVLLAAACNSDANQPSATGAPQTTTTVAPTTTTTATSSEAIAAFRECMAGNGFEIEEIPIDATGRPRLDLVMATLDFGDAEVAEAVSRCTGHLETGALDLGGEDQLRETVLEQLREFSDCMVDLGVEDFPDPVPGYMGVGSPFPVAEIPYADPDFASAAQVCREGLLESLPGS